MNRIASPGAILGLSLLLVAGLIPAGPSPAAPRPVPRSASSPQEARRIRVQVNLVNVVASVLDSHGRPVPDLPRQAFAVYEEGVQQRIDRFEPQTNQPLDLALMIDSSLSTVQELKFEREAAASFVRELVHPGDGLAIFQFADTVTQLSNFTSDVPALEEALRRIEPGAGTALYDAVFLGSSALDRRPPERRRVIVLLTDAGETTSRSDFDSARRAALRAGAMLYTILIRAVKSESGRNTAGEHALQTITDVTGGAMYDLDSLDQLNATFDRINRELRTEYLLGYYPSPKPPANSFREVDVRVNYPPPAGDAGGYFVRHRKGYFTAGSPE